MLCTKESQPSFFTFPFYYFRSNYFYDEEKEKQQNGIPKLTFVAKTTEESKTGSSIVKNENKGE